MTSRVVVLGARRGAVTVLLIGELRTDCDLKEVLGPPSALSKECLMGVLERYDDAVSCVIHRLSVDEVVRDTLHPRL